MVMLLGFPGESDVVLVVSKDRRGQVEGNLLEGLALRLVVLHGEGGAHWKLTATDLYARACSLGRCPVSSHKDQVRMSISPKYA